MQSNIQLDDEKFIKLFGNDFSRKSERFANFIASTPPKKIFKTTFAPPFLSLAAGGAIGGLIGSFGGPKGTAVGLGSGMGVGFLAGSTYAGYQTRKEYMKWIKRHRCDEILTPFAELISQHPDIQDFICPLTNTFMHYPFKDPGGFSYERKAIEQWVKKHGTSPKMGVPIKLSDLQPNYALMGKQAKMYKGLLENELSKSQFTNLQREGITAVLKDLQRQIQHCFEAENRILYTKLVNNEISRRTYSRKILLISEMFEDDV